MQPTTTPDIVVIPTAHEVGQYDDGSRHAEPGTVNPDYCEEMGY